MTAAPLRLVLLPGLNGDGELFAPLLAELPASLHPLILPLPGTGAQDHASLARALRPQLEALDGPFMVLGESFSGALAHRLCNELDHAPLGLILASSFLQRPRTLLPPAALLGSLRGLLLEPWLIKAFCLGAGAAPELVALVGRQVAQLPTALLNARLEVLRSMRPPQLKLALPTLQLAARQDRLVSGAASRGTAHYCSDLQRIELDGPHFLLQREPRACAQAIAAFAVRLTSRELP